MRQIFCLYKSNSGEIARSRLKLLLMADKMHCSPGLIELIREDLLLVLSRYGEFDPLLTDIRLTRMECAGTADSLPAISAKIPIRCLYHMRNE